MSTYCFCCIMILRHHLVYLLTVNSSTKEVDDSRHTRYNTYNFSSFYAETLIKGIINKDPLVW